MKYIWIVIIVIIELIWMISAIHDIYVNAKEDLIKDFDIGMFFFDLGTSTWMFIVTNTTILFIFSLAVWINSKVG